MLAKATSLGKPGRYPVPPQRWTLALWATRLPPYWSPKWTGTRAGSNRRPDLFRIPLLPSITTTIRRVKYRGTDPLTSKVMLGIVMDGTMPMFYKIPITAELVRAVETGKQPEQETVVHAYVPASEVPIARLSVASGRIVSQGFLNTRRCPTSRVPTNPRILSAPHFCPSYV